MIDFLLGGTLSPLCLALLVLGAGAALRWHWRRRRVGACVAGLGALLAAGALGHFAARAAWWARHPAPGVLPDAGGFRLHVMCEGVAPPGTPGVLLFSGGYGQGLWMAHLQAALRGQTRACWWDRPGTGWSEAAPAPRTPQKDAAALAAALDNAGEHGRFILVGHSLGGMQAAVFAGMFPERVAGVMGLDATPASLAPIGQRAWCPPLAARLLPYGQALGAGFGLVDLIPRLNPLRSAGPQRESPALAPYWPVIAGNEERASSILGMSRFIDPLCGDVLGTVFRPGALGALPVVSITQTPPPEDRIRDMYSHYGFTPLELANALALDAQSRGEFAALSTHARALHSPPGTTHYFPMQAPDLVVGEIRAMLADPAVRGAP